MHTYYLLKNVSLSAKSVTVVIATIDHYLKKSKKKLY